jgi:two-component system, chemotaxis family, protein-glutamate methylesterase/glutaminase
MTGMVQRKVRVLVVDDSALMRKLLSQLLSEDPQIEVVDTAPDPLAAREKIKALNPDVVTLDVEMPNMDGVTFLRKIMALRPMPVVMISSLTQAGTNTTLEALESGAVDFVAKPATDIANGMAALAKELQTKIKSAAVSRVGARPARARAVVPAPQRLNRSTGKLIAIGASTGGVEALKELLMGLPPDVPPTLITQHMPEKFTTAFAARLSRECPMTVHEAAHNQRIEPGNVYIAPGSHHLELARDGLHYICKLSDGERVSGHKPSVDVLFRSFAQLAGPKTIGVILTGMGKDGAAGLLELRRARATTLGQDAATSLVYGMPRAAFEGGGVMRQVPLNKMADAIIAACNAEAPARMRA